MSNGSPIVEQELTPASLAFVGEQLSPSPFHFRFTGEDFLEIASYNAQAGVVIAVQGRTWTSEEGIRPFAFHHIPNTDRTRDLEVFGLARGYLLNAVVFAASGAPRVGQTFVSLHVIRGLGQARVLLATLLQGYVTAEQELGFPGSPIVNSLSGPGVIRVVEGTDVAIGVQWAETVPAGVRWELLSVSARLTTGATAASRLPVLQLYSADRLIFHSPNPAIVGASTISDFTWARGMPIGVAIDTRFPIAGLLTEHALQAGDVIGTFTQNFQASDNWGAPIFLVKETLEAQ